jgi:hypothetical protein
LVLHVKVEQPSGRIVEPEIVLGGWVPTVSRRSEWLDSQRRDDLAKRVRVAAFDEEVEISGTRERGLEVLVALPRAVGDPTATERVNEREETGKRPRRIFRDPCDYPRVVNRTPPTSSRRSTLASERRREIGRPAEIRYVNRATSNRVAHPTTTESRACLPQTH